MDDALMKQIEALAAMMKQNEPLAAMCPDGGAFRGITSAVSRVQQARGNLSSSYRSL